MVHYNLALRGEKNSGYENGNLRENSREQDRAVDEKYRKRN